VHTVAHVAWAALGTAATEALFETDGDYLWPDDIRAWGGVINSFGRPKAWGSHDKATVTRPPGFEQFELVGKAELLTAGAWGQF